MKKVCSVLAVLAVLLSCLCGVSFAAEPEARWTDGTVTYEGTLIEMNDHCWKGGGTLTLLADVFMEDRGHGRYALNFDSSVVFDLNGHSVGTNGGGLLISAGASESVIKDSAGGGMIFGMGGAALTLRNGSLNAENVTFFSKTDFAISSLALETAVLTNCTLISAYNSPLYFEGGAKPLAELKDCMLLSDAGVAAVSCFMPGTLIKAENTKFCTEGQPLADGLTVEGLYTERLTETVTLEIRGERYENVPVYGLTANPPAPEVPAEPEAPVDPAPSAEPDAPVEPEVSAEPELPVQPESPTEEKSGITVGMIVGIAAAVVVIVAVVVLVRKKKK